MTKQERVRFIIDKLNELYPEIPIPLDHKDPYTLLIAVLLSAQSTDVRVNKTTPILFEKADNPYDMVKLSVEEIREIIKPVGLSPMKSKGIHGLSEILIEKHNGKVPQSFEALESLPAVGHKTASVVMSQAFGIPAFPVATHPIWVRTKTAMALASTSRCQLNTATTTTIQQRDASSRFLLAPASPAPRAGCLAFRICERRTAFPVLAGFLQGDRRRRADGHGAGVLQALHRDGLHDDLWQLFSR